MNKGSTYDFLISRSYHLAESIQRKLLSSPLPPSMTRSSSSIILPSLVIISWLLVNLMIFWVENNIVDNHINQPQDGFSVNLFILIKYANKPNNLKTNILTKIQHKNTPECFCVIGKLFNSLSSWRCFNVEAWVKHMTCNLKTWEKQERILLLRYFWSFLKSDNLSYQ